MGRVLTEFYKDARGSIILPLLFTFVFIFGSMALAVDSLRYFTVQSLLEKSALSAAVFASKNRETLPLSEIRNLAADMAQLEFVGGLQSFIRSASLDTIQITQINAGSTTKVELTASISTTLMQAFNYSEKLSTESNVIVSSGLENLEIALVVDRTEDASISSLRDDIKDTAKSLVSHIQKMSDASSGSVSIGIVPLGSSMMNVGERKSWTDDAEWPSNLPPNVPGNNNWTGSLEEQRWCVGLRGAERASNLPPASEKFPLVLTIEKTEGATPEQDIYSIATPLECSAAALQPLTTNHGSLTSYLSSLKANGPVAIGSAFAWAERLLLPEWRMDWNIGGGTPAEYDSETVKLAILMNASDPGNDARQIQLLKESCDRMKSNGIRVYIVDYDTALDTESDLKACATAEHYYFIASDKESLMSALKDIIKSLVTVRVIQIGST